MSDNKLHESDTSILIPIMLVCLILFIVWCIFYFWGVEIRHAIRLLRVGEMWFFSEIFYLVGADDTASALDYERKKLLEISRYKLTIEDIKNASMLLAPYFRWPVVIVLCYLGYTVFNKTASNKFKRKYDLEGIIKAQAQEWPVISPIMNFNPKTTSERVPGSPLPKKLPIFAEALSPEEWVAYNKIPVRSGTPDKEAMRRAFIRQLGKPWRGVKTLSTYQKALFAAFALKGVRRREESDELMGEIARHWSKEHGLSMPTDLKVKINNLLNDPKVGGEAEKIAKNHAYVTTAMIRILLWSRERGGVLAPATFIWLRAVDRHLWYPLNNTGRRSFHPEAAGAMAHYFAERNADKPLKVARVDPAVDSVIQYIAEQKPEIPPGPGQKKTISLDKKEEA